MGCAGDKEDATKKRRVERSRKMAEAKERNSTLVIPSDIQSVLKRCENLEKEVRSLKLNLSFMNRKDSEQTKQIEELQQKNEELSDEKERLLEEIERTLAENDIKRLKGMEKLSMLGVGLATKPYYLKPRTPNLDKVRNLVYSKPSFGNTIGAGMI